MNRRRNDKRRVVVREPRLHLYEIAVPSQTYEVFLIEAADYRTAITTAKAHRKQPQYPGPKRVRVLRLKY